MKRAAVLGAAGFLGRHFSTALASRGWTVSRCDTRLGWDAHALFMSGATFDLVVHCAAVEPHRAAIDSKPLHLAANLHLDAAMFEWAARVNVGRVLYISSSAAYPVELQGPSGRHAQQYGSVVRRLSEGDVEFGYGIGWPDANYGWTKLSGELVTRAARDAGLPVTVVRPFSGYGEDQGEDWPFGAFVARARRRVDPFTIWGDGTQVRDWIHVADVVAGALAMVDAEVDGPVNLCTGHGTSMRELVDMICAEAGYRPAIELHPEMPAGVAFRVGDPSLMHQHYIPQVSLAEGVKRALAI